MAMAMAISATAGAVPGANACPCSRFTTAARSSSTFCNTRIRSRSSGYRSMQVVSMSAARKTNKSLVPQEANPQNPLRAFPWETFLKRFTLRMWDLVWTTLKLLTVPALMISSVGEIHYAIYHKKALFVPVSVFLGIVTAGIVHEVWCELASEMLWDDIRAKNAFPWYLVVLGAIFALVKLPGPSYPYWARLVLPHFANGGLWMTCYLVWQWHKFRRWHHSRA